ncbi:PGPGW domain-containing protein [Rhabdothermincola salaria]|uniref:PGPGW domain-containing protein n=1 Tax=Rhabdothermincola salaria TaxID=2903142 RepID=UPI001E55AF40|nr:PGPGW domain-containing protein [Rhabdothermincola salaria]MCD9624124.1 hypothetical protein [Rhabdothermincola salaria]
MADDEPGRPHGHHEHPRLEALEEAALAAEMETGRREETRAEAKRSLLRRLGRMTAGSFLCVLGLVLMVLPGPGLLTLAAGLLILSVDVPFAARLLEKVRARLPADADGNVPRHVVVSGVGVSVLALGASMWWTFLR